MTAIYDWDSLPVAFILIYEDRGFIVQQLPGQVLGGVTVIFLSLMISNTLFTEMAAMLSINNQVHC